MKYVRWALCLVTILMLSACPKKDGHAPGSSTTEYGAPAAAINLTATAGNSNVILNWVAGSASTLQITYTVQRSEISGGTYYDVSGCVDVTALTCTDSSVANETVYYYIVVAKNNIGSSPNSNEATVIPTAAFSPPGAIAYSNSAPAYVTNSAITNNNPTVAAGGGPITSWSIVPDLAAATGLTFNTTTGEISGTPTLISNPGLSYTVSASNAYGTSTVNIIIRVTASVVAPTISYSGIYTYLAGQPIAAPVTPILGGGTPTSCTSAPALPAGMVLNPTTCVISGTPTATIAQQLFTITATNAGGSNSASVDIGVLSLVPTSIAINGVANFTTSACALFNVTARDVFGNPSAVSANTTFNLSGAGSGGAFYSDSSCSTVVTSVVIPNASSSAVFYYRKMLFGTATLSATLSTPVNPALGSATRSVTIAMSSPAKIGITVPATGTSVSCNTVVINVLDSSDNNVEATSALTVNLSGTGSAIFYSGATCTGTITNVPMASGAMTATVYMRKISVGTSTLTASATGMASGSAVIVISVGSAQMIRFSSAAAIPYAALTCQAYTLQTRDALNNNAAPVSADTIVDLSGVADGSFYSNSTCSPGNAMTSTTILSGASSRIIYFSKPTATAAIPGSNIVLTASVLGWTPNATTTVNVSSGGTINLATANTAVGLAVSTATAVTLANRCILTTVRVQDELNALVPAANVTSPIIANLSGGGPGAQFWSNSSCTTPTSTVTINAGANTGNFYYSSTATTAAVAISWDNGGLGGSGGSRTVTVSNGVPSRLTWTTGPTSFNINTCQTFTLNVRDPNLVTAIGVNVGAATSFALTDGSDGQFFQTAGCSNPITSITIANGAQAATFYYRKSTPTPPAATISVNLTSPAVPVIATLTRAVTVSIPAPVPNNILITAAPASSLVATQSCSLLTLQSRNGTTAANVTSATAVTLAATNGGTFYYDSGCTAVASPSILTIANATNSASGLYIKTANTGNVTVSGTSSITVNNLVLNYGAPPPTMLALSGPILMNAGTGCGRYTVTTQDNAGIARNVSASTPVALANTGAVAVQFYSNASCTTVLSGSQVTINSGANSATFYVRGNSSGAAEIRATNVGLTTSQYSITIQ